MIPRETDVVVISAGNVAGREQRRERDYTDVGVRVAPATDRARIVLTCMDALMPQAQGSAEAAYNPLHFHHPWRSDVGS